MVLGPHRVINNTSGGYATPSFPFMHTIPKNSHTRYIGSKSDIDYAILGGAEQVSVIFKLVYLFKYAPK